MSGSVSKTILVGNLTADPDIRSTQAGKKVASFRLATNERWKTRDGEMQERSEYHNVVIWNEHLVSVAEKYLKKGAKVYLEGQNQTRKWKDQQGNDRYSTEVVLNPYKAELQMLDSKPRGEPKQERVDHPFGDENDWMR